MNQAGRTRRSLFPPRPQLVGILLLLCAGLGILTALNASTYRPEPISFGDVTGSEIVDVGGYVFNVSGLQLTPALVVMDNGTAHAFTNLDGYYLLKNITTGDHQLKATFPGHVTYYQNVTINSGMPMMVDFALEEGTRSIYVDERYHPESPSLGNATALLALGIMIFSLLAAVGGFFSIFWEHYNAAVLGSIFALLSYGFLFGSFIGLVALILVLEGKREYLHLPTPKKRPRRAWTPMTKDELIREGVENRDETETMARDMDRLDPDRGDELLFGDEGKEGGSYCTLCKGWITTSFPHKHCECGAPYHNACVATMEACIQCNRPFSESSTTDHGASDGAPDTELEDGLVESDGEVPRPQEGVQPPNSEDGFSEMESGVSRPEDEHL